MQEETAKHGRHHIKMKEPKIIINICLDCKSLKCMGNCPKIQRAKKKYKEKKKNAKRTNKNIKRKA